MRRAAVVRMLAVDSAIYPEDILRARPLGKAPDFKGRDSHPAIHGTGLPGPVCRSATTVTFRWNVNEK